MKVPESDYDSTWLATLSPCPSVRPRRFPARSLCGLTQNSAGWIEPKRVIYDHELILIADGEYRIDVGPERHVCPAGTFLIIPPGQWHTSQCLQRGRRWYAHFDWHHASTRPDESPVMTFHPAEPDPARLRLAPDDIPPGILHGKIRSPSVVLDLMQRLNLMLLNAHPHERLAARGVLLELLIRLLDDRPVRNGTTHRQEELAHRVREVLDDAMAEPKAGISIRRVLTQVGQSYEHLARSFRHQYGLTPVEYVHSIRIERAKHLLRQTDQTIDAIADAIGYQDGVYFSRLFKRHTGLSPGQFRRD